MYKRYYPGDIIKKTGGKNIGEDATVESQNDQGHVKIQYHASGSHDETYDYWCELVTRGDGFEVDEDSD